MTKLTTTERRAKRFCEQMITFEGGSVGVEWRKSRMWGSNPVILFNGEKCTNINGCGYDKLSAALASVLCYLFPIDSEEYRNIASLQGSGESTVIKQLEAQGWILEKTGCGASYDTYKLTTKPAEETPPPPPADPAPERHTPNGYDPAWVSAINGALADRETGIEITDVSGELWDEFIGPMLDAIEDGDTEAPTK